MEGYSASCKTRKVFKENRRKANEILVWRLMSTTELAKRSIRKPRPGASRQIECELVDHWSSMIRKKNTSALVWQRINILGAWVGMRYGRSLATPVQQILYAVSWLIWAIISVNHLGNSKYAHKTDLGGCYGPKPTYIGPLKTGLGLYFLMRLTFQLLGLTIVLRSLSLPSILAAGNLILLLVSLRDWLTSFCTVVIFHGIICWENKYNLN